MRRHHLELVPVPKKKLSVKVVVGFGWDKQTSSRGLGPPALKRVGSSERSFFLLFLYLLTTTPGADIPHVRLANGVHAPCQVPHRQ